MMSTALHCAPFCKPSRSFYQKNKSCRWTLISKYFTHGLRELSLLTQKVNIPHMHFSPTFVKFKKGVYFAHLVFLGPENFWERNNKKLWFPCQLSPLNFSSNFQKRQQPHATCFRLNFYFAKTFFKRCRLEQNKVIYVSFYIFFSTSCILRTWNAVSQT